MLLLVELTKEDVETVPEFKRYCSERPDVTITVVQEHGVGYAYAIHDDTHLHYLYVDSKARRAGYGEYMVKYLCKLTEALRVAVPREDLAMVSLLVKLSFVRVGVSEDHDLYEMRSEPVGIHRLNRLGVNGDAVLDRFSGDMLV